MKAFLVLLFTTLLLNAKGATIDIRLEIVNGTLSLPGGQNVPVKCFKQQADTLDISDLLIWTSSDDVNLRVVNLDTINHNFIIDGIVDYGTILPGDSAEQNIVITTPGIYRYLDDINSPYQEYLGLAGIIHVKASGDTTPYFYWDLHEFEPDLNDSIFSGSSPGLSNYYPDYFTLNGRSAPNINNDSVARITGSVGSEFRLVIMNNGLSIHSMHFHGYHLTSIADTKYMTGRSKDTFPVYPGGHLLLSCTPDKEGEYPVHDHNLVAVTGGQVYANGIFITMLIDP